MSLPTHSFGLSFGSSPKLFACLIKLGRYRKYYWIDIVAALMGSQCLVTQCPKWSFRSTVRPVFKNTPLKEYPAYKHRLWGGDPRGPPNPNFWFKSHLLKEYPSLKNSFCCPRTGTLKDRSDCNSVHLNAKRHSVTLNRILREI